MAEALDALFSPTLDALDLALPWNYIQRLERKSIYNWLKRWLSNGH